MCPSRDVRHTCTTEDRDCPRDGYHDRGLVFPQRDGNYRDPNKFLTLFQDAIGAYNRCHLAEPLRVINLHSLRHGWSTIAGELGVSDAVRMDRLDQSSLEVNRRYIHAQRQAMEEAARAVSDAVFGDSVELGRIGA
jgi:integrase